MRTLLITTLLSSLVSLVSTAQVPTARIQADPELPTNIERYGIDYKLKDYSFTSGDSTILESIPLEQYESMRSNESDVEIFDPISGQTLILFHEKKSKSSANQTLNH